jgi:hypothetical protein
VTEHRNIQKQTSRRDFIFLTPFFRLRRLLLNLQARNEWHLSAIQNRPGYFSAGHQTPSQSGLGATA